MRRPALLAALALTCAAAAPALAHEGNPDFESLVNRVDGVDGLRAQVINGDDRLLLINTSGATVVVEGYDSEPYARLRPDGRVEVNRRSSATYLNEERFGKVDVPAIVDPKAPPQWRQVGRNGRFEFHDHRIHWMVEGDPPKVKDKAKRQQVFAWSVPVRTEPAGTAGSVQGTLWWRGSEDDGPPVGAYAAGGVLVLGSLLLVVVVRRRRSRAETGGGAAAPPAREEAW